jgi:glycosyltransferase involved in cell wall biosynthesis
MAQSPISPEHKSLCEVVRTAQRLSIPTVLWNTKDYLYHEHYKDFAQHFEQVFCADPREAEILGKENIDAEILLPCVQPAIHNPYRTFEAKDRFSHDVIWDGWSDLFRKGCPIGVNRLRSLGANVHIIESRSRYMKNHLIDNNILGCVTYKELITILKFSNYVLMPEPTMDTQTSRIWRALEQAATGPVVFFYGTKTEHSNLDNIVIYVNNLNIQSVYRELSGDELLRRKYAIIARRNIYNDHTYSHRVRNICQKLGIHHDWEEYPSVSIIIATYRPHLKQNCIETYDKQIYKNKELILLCHYNEPQDFEIDSALNDSIRECYMPHDLPIGKVLAYGAKAARGDYAVRMDDDDMYGKFYLQDAMFVPRMFDVEIWGKPPGFFYSEKDDATYLRRQSAQQECIIKSDDFMRSGIALAGNSIFGTKSFLEHIYRAAAEYANGADSIAQQIAKKSVKYFINSDCFDVLVWRGKDLNEHQHRLDTVPNSQFVCNGIIEQKVMLNSLKMPRGHFLPYNAIHDISLPSCEIFSSDQCTDLNIACIVTDLIYECIKFDAHCIQLLPDKQKQQIANRHIDFVLVQSAFDNEIPKWNGGTATGYDYRSFDMLRLLCNEKKIPIVFWYTYEREHCVLFKDIAEKCDYVYTMDSDSAQQFTFLIGDAKIKGTLLPAIQPKLHNPVISEERLEKYKDKQIKILFDGIETLFKYLNHLKPIFLELINEDVAIVESKWEISERKLQHMKELKKIIRGSISYHQLLFAMKICNVYFIPCSSDQTKNTLIREAIEAICCGATIVTDAKFPMLEEMGLNSNAIIQSDMSSFVKILKNFDPNKKLSDLHVARRSLYLEHSYLNRLETICNDINLGVDFNRAPKISVITSTRRYEFVDYSVRKFEEQKYKNKELILVLHINSKSLIREAYNRFKDRPDISIIAMPVDVNLGTCLNTAISKCTGDFWFKVDDDDHYGENYILDMVLAQRMTDADLCGKHYKYLHKEGHGLYLRGKFERGYIVPVTDKRHLTGATIMARTAIFDKVRFVSNVITGTDALFFIECLAGKLKILIVDPYNFIVYRGSSESGHNHTWTLPNGYLEKNCSFLGKYDQYLDSIFI